MIAPQPDFSSSLSRGSHVLPAAAAREDLRPLRQALPVAQEVGALLGGGEVLQRRLPEGDPSRPRGRHEKA